MENYKFEIKDFFLAHSTINEYGEKGAFLGLFSTKKKAEMVAAKRGWYGGAGRVTPVRGIVAPTGEVYVIMEPHGTDDLCHIVDQNLEKYATELKDSALSKLTEAEKVAMGLK